mgnify:CR=1 FL=1
MNNQKGNDFVYPHSQLNGFSAFLDFQGVWSLLPKQITHHNPQVDKRDLTICQCLPSIYSKFLSFK